MIIHVKRVIVTGIAAMIVIGIIFNYTGGIKEQVTETVPQEVVKQDYPVEVPAEEVEVAAVDPKSEPKDVEEVDEPKEEVFVPEIIDRGRWEIEVKWIDKWDDDWHYEDYEALAKYYQSCEELIKSLQNKRGDYQDKGHKIVKATCDEPDVTWTHDGWIFDRDIVWGERHRFDRVDIYDIIHVDKSIPLIDGQGKIHRD